MSLTLAFLLYVVLLFILTICSGECRLDQNNSIPFVAQKFVFKREWTVHSLPVFHRGRLTLEILYPLNCHIWERSHVMFLRYLEWWFFSRTLYIAMYAVPGAGRYKRSDISIETDDSYITGASWSRCLLLYNARSCVTSAL